MMPIELKIREDFRDWCPPLTAQEFDQLDASIVTQGCREAIVVWKGENVIVDGHNRYAICRKRDIEFRIHEMGFRDENHARNFIILNQLGRRNLAPDAAAILRGKLHISKKKEPHDGGKGSVRNSCAHSETTAEQIAKQTGVSPRTVQNDAKFAAACDALGITQDVMAGKEKRSRKEIIRQASEKNGTRKSPPKRQVGMNAADRRSSLLKELTDFISEKTENISLTQRVILFDELHAWLEKETEPETES